MSLYLVEFIKTLDFAYKGNDDVNPKKPAPLNKSDLHCWQTFDFIVFKVT